MKFWLGIESVTKSSWFLKVDFEKAFDSLRWDFLDLVMEKLGFGHKWRSWIQGCLRNARSSILANDSPTPQFEIFKGLRQGDPLSPFLFILAMESLHAFTCKAEDLGLFKGAFIGRDNMSISHLMYADDVIFFGEWSRNNAHNLICMLRYLFLISGLKINVHKSDVIGIGVSDEEVSCMANVIGCWKFSSKLSLRKARLLSVGGRLSLIKSVLGNLPTYYMSIYLMSTAICNNLESLRNKFFIGCDQGDKKMRWVKWKRCLANKNNGGLGIGSIYGLNIGLLFKWIWRVHLSDLSGVLRRNRRGKVEQSQFDALLAAIENVSLSDQGDSYRWSRSGCEEFSVASVRTLVNDFFLEVGNVATR
nr:hypothetical protein [Tanacetum cinerariifolium]